MFDKICILGCGLIGSSLLRAIHKKKLANKLSAFDKSKNVSLYLAKNFSFHNKNRKITKLQTRIHNVLSV